MLTSPRLLIIFIMLVASLALSGCALVPAAPAALTSPAPTTAGLPAALPAAATVAAPPAPAQVSAGWPTDAPVYLVAADPALVQSIQVETLPAVPNNGAVMFADSHPAFLRFRLQGFLPGYNFQLPYPNDGPQVLFMQTQDFGSYGADTPAGFPDQLKALQGVLQSGLDAQRCSRPLTGPAGGDAPLPFLPWVNAQQVFCAQPKVVSFQGGQGLRYLTFFSQGINPVLDGQVFYTFQGLSSDGRVYVAAFLPVKTGLFPEQYPTPPAALPDPNYLPNLAAGLQQLNVQPESAFQPTLAQLDGIIQSIQVK